MTVVDFANRKLALARELAAGDCGGDDDDASLVTAAIVSRMAADLWGGEQIDRARFVEVWARDSDPALIATWISIPLLCARLRKLGTGDEANELEKARPRVFGPGFYTRVPTGKDVDMKEAEVMERCPTLTLKEIREFSYPNVYYQQVRCSTSHEYRTGPDVTSHPMHTDAYVSYTNRRSSGGDFRRLIHFHRPWLDAVVRSIAKSVEAEIESGQQRKQPTVWWIGGG